MRKTLGIWRVCVWPWNGETSRHLWVISKAYGEGWFFEVSCCLGYEKEREEGFNHGLFVCFFPQNHKSQASVKFSVIRVKTECGKCTGRWDPGEGQRPSLLLKSWSQVLGSSQLHAPLTTPPMCRGASQTISHFYKHEPRMKRSRCPCCSSNNKNKDHNSISHFHINWQKLSLLEKWNFPVFTFLHHRTGHFCCLGSYVHTRLHTHFKPHSLKQLITRWTKIKDILQGDNQSIYFLYHRKVLSKRVIL